MVTYAKERAQPLEFTTPKDPNDVVVYEFDWSSELATGETISTRTVTVASGLTKDSDTLAGSSTKVQVTVSGGTTGRDYSVTCQVVTSSSRTLELTGVIKCRER